MNIFFNLKRDEEDIDFISWFFEYIQITSLHDQIVPDLNNNPFNISQYLSEEFNVSLMGEIGEELLNNEKFILDAVFDFENDG